ncbi:hypothetical protein AB1K83_05105, partial [Sporosarcina sp. 179-K 3D1 HS]|uniref:hypothetical protein n=1 Tax=Sporosarcina sp. 179-K 3D1 HS TaxID=3232169 RepID=UPI0039A07216
VRFAVFLRTLQKLRHIFRTAQGSICRISAHFAEIKAHLSAAQGSICRISAHFAEIKAHLSNSAGFDLPLQVKLRPKP